MKIKIDQLHDYTVHFNAVQDFVKLFVRAIS